MTYEREIDLVGRRIAIDQPTYFMADLASNHDGELERAKDLIHRASDAGADAVKFQHFLASEIVSDRGFQDVGQVSHQTRWKKSVYEVYEDFELNRDWTQELSSTAKAAGVDFLTTPYDVEAVEMLDPLVPAFKVGSGDITWTSFLAYVAGKGKPVLLATGASSLEDVTRAVEVVLERNPRLVLMQCNTNYTGSADNFGYINLRVLQTYADRWPDLPLGLSDHTAGHTTVLGAVALGARVIEKHFTDDVTRSGPDHGFSMEPKPWREMVDRTRELESSLGDGVKRVEPNEVETAVVQRRALRAKRRLEEGTILSATELEALRPCPAGATPPYAEEALLGYALIAAKERGDLITPADVKGVSA